MNSKSLDERQVRVIANAVRRYHRFFLHFCGRMHQTHFPQNDPLKVHGERSREELEALLAELEKLPGGKPKWG